MSQPTVYGPGNIPNMLQVGPPSAGSNAQTATIPFWDVPTQSIEPGDNTFSPWDTCSIGGIFLPGLSQVESKKHKRLDVKKAKGQDNATITFTGYDPAEIQITVRIWTQSQLNVLQSVLPMLKPSSKAFKAMDVWHPSLALLGIKSVVVDMIEALKQSSVKGVWQMSIHCLEFNKPPPTKKNVTATATSSGTYLQQSEFVIKATQPSLLNGQTLIPPSINNVGTK